MVAAKDRAPTSIVNDEPQAFTVVRGERRWTVRAVTPFLAVNEWGRAALDRPGDMALVGVEERGGQKVGRFHVRAAVRTRRDVVLHHRAHHNEIGDDSERTTVLAAGELLCFVREA